MDIITMHLGQSFLFYWLRNPLTLFYPIYEITMCYTTKTFILFQIFVIWPTSFYNLEFIIKALWTIWGLYKRINDLKKVQRDSQIYKTSWVEVLTRELAMHFYMSQCNIPTLGIRTSNSKEGKRSTITQPYMRWAFLLGHVILFDEI